MEAIIEKKSDEQVMMKVLQKSAVRLHNHKWHFSKDAWKDFSTYDGPIVLGDPEGKLHEDLLKDDE